LHVPELDFAISSQARRSHYAETSSSSYGLDIRFQLLSTPPLGDAVTFSYTFFPLTWRGLSPLWPRTRISARAGSSSSSYLHFLHISSILHIYYKLSFSPSFIAISI